MGATSTEVKQNWENRNYNKYLVRLRKDIDAESIAYIEARKELPITSRILSGSIIKLVILGAYFDTSALGASIALRITSSMI